MSDNLPPDAWRATWERSRALAGRITALSVMKSPKEAREHAVVLPDELGAEFESFLMSLWRVHGIDLTGYKRASVYRRVRKRMMTVGISEFSPYLTHLERLPEEREQLRNAVLINVTSFFRDGTPWDYLRQEFLPDLFARKFAGSAIRAWSAGCATGEEAYSIAMIMAEVLGVDEFRERVKIYATDVDEDALTKARQATYDAKQVAVIPQELRERYFEPQGERYLFRRDLRHSVIIGRNDLAKDSPISQIDLLVSRNTLMYFNAPTQAKILARFHFALNDDGYLLLGRSETLLTHKTPFTPVDLKRRIFIKSSTARARRDLGRDL